MALDNFLNDLITEADTHLFNILDVLKHRASETPDERAFIFLRDGEDQEELVNWSKLEATSRELAVRLMQGNHAGSRALLLFPPGMEFVYSLFGCMMAGVIAVPAYPPRKNRSLERIRKIVTDSEASIILTTQDIHQSFNRSFSDVTELKTLEWVVFDANPSGNAGPANNGFPIPAVQGQEQVALLQYTSGSTGNPKGVMITHRNIMRNCEFIRQSFGFSRKTVAVSWLPTFHDMGLVGQVFQPVYTGFTSVLMSPVSFFQKPVRWLKAFTKYRGTMGGAPNFAFDLLTESVTEDERRGLDLSTIKTIYCGAEPIRKATFDLFLETYTPYGLKPEMLYPCYGMAETTLITTGPPAGRGPVYLPISEDSMLGNKIEVTDDRDQEARFLVGVGFPWLDTKVRIVNPDTGVPCKDDEIGEIWISGSSVSPGYWGKPDINREIFGATLDGEPGVNFLRSGDLGFMNNGELYVSGRLKDLIIINGRNIYPQDIEYIAEHSHPALRHNASAAFSIEADGLEKLVIVAEVERAAIIGLEVEAVCDSIRESIALETELAVHRIQLLRTASILKTSSGKIQRKACRQAFLEGKLEVVGDSGLDMPGADADSAASAVNLVSLEAWLMLWIHEKLKIPLNRIDSSRPITAFGLTSMKAVALQQDFLDTYGVNFPPYMFFERISVKELAERAYKLIVPPAGG